MARKKVNYQVEPPKPTGPVRYCGLTGNGRTIKIGEEVRLSAPGLEGQTGHVYEHIEDGSYGIIVYRVVLLDKTRWNIGPTELVPVNKP